MEAISLDYQIHTTLAYGHCFEMIQSENGRKNKAQVMGLSTSTIPMVNASSSVRRSYGSSPSPRGEEHRLAHRRELPVLAAAVFLTNYHRLLPRHRSPRWHAARVQFWLLVTVGELVAWLWSL
jgi:hypothetical protein